MLVKINPGSVLKSDLKRVSSNFIDFMITAPQKSALQESRARLKFAICLNAASLKIASCSNVVPIKTASCANSASAKSTRFAKDAFKKSAHPAYFDCVNIASSLNLAKEKSVRCANLV